MVNSSSSMKISGIVKFGLVASWLSFPSSLVGAVPAQKVHVDCTVLICGRYFGFQEREKMERILTTWHVSKTEREVFVFYGQRHLGSRVVIPTSIASVFVMTLVFTSALSLWLFYRWRIKHKR